MISCWYHLKNGHKHNENYFKPARHRGRGSPQFGDVRRYVLALA